MKTVILITFSVICMVSFNGCSKGVPIKTTGGEESNYVKKRFRIHYIDTQGNIFIYLFPYNPIDADRKTFVALDRNIGKDKNWVYFQDKKQKHVDCATFEITDEGVIRDKNFRYRKNTGQARLIPIIENERYTKIETLIANNRDKVKTGEPYDYDDEWIRRVEKRLSFKLPDSYVWLMCRYGSIEFEFDRVKVITYPDFRLDQETSILNQTNRKERGLSSNKLIIMENNAKTYYFLYEKGLAGNEYKVYVMNNLTKTTELFASDFLEFIELQIN